MSESPTQLKQLQTDPEQNDIYEDSRTNEFSRVIVQVASYERLRSEEDHHYDSVTKEAPNTLERDSLYPTVHVFCSDQCRKRAEYEDLHRLARVKKGECPNHNINSKLSEIKLEW